MISGTIANNEALINLHVAGRDQSLREVTAVIDTGYSGHLTLPSRWISTLQLPFAGHRRGRLADGSVVILDMYLGTVVWHGRQLEVLILQATGSPLVGMSLLRGSRVQLEVVDGGRVTISDLRQQD